MLNEEPGATRKMETMVAEPPPRTDEFKLSGDSVIAKIQELVQQGVASPEHAAFVTRLQQAASEPRQ